MLGAPRERNKCGGESLITYLPTVDVWARACFQNCKSTHYIIYMLVEKKGCDYYIVKNSPSNNDE